MIFRGYFPAAVLVLLIGAPCLAQQQSGNAAVGAPPAKKELMLSGGIEHSEKLPSFDERYRPGKAYTPLEGTIQEGQSGVWYKIPAWMAARRWHSEKRTEYYWEDLRTGKVRRDPITLTVRADQAQGWQTDSAGNIWQYSAVPFVSKTENDDEFTAHLISVMEPVEVADGRFVKRSRSVQIDVGKSDNLIRKVEQDEQIHVFTPMQDGLIRCDDSSKVFDMDGNPLRIEKAFEVQTRVTPYSPIATNNGMDVREAFSRYLVEHGMPNLVPPVPHVPVAVPAASPFPSHVAPLVQ